MYPHKMDDGPRLTQEMVTNELDLNASIKAKIQKL